VGLSHDPTTVDVATLRASVQRLLTEEAFATGAGQVRAEMAAQPSPAAVVERVVAALA
jgi:UDP:flavonoid glycosyltransferase YjiC (YdhE family)